MRLWMVLLILFILGWVDIVVAVTANFFYFLICFAILCVIARWAFNVIKQLEHKYYHNSE
jgi:hypothetical protein